MKQRYEFQFSLQIISLHYISHATLHSSTRYSLRARYINEDSYAGTVLIDETASGNSPWNFCRCTRGPTVRRRTRMIRLRGDTTRRVFPSSLGGWPSFVDGLRRSTETAARKRASATKRTPTTVTSYTTDFISLCYVPRRDVGCRKPTISLRLSPSPTLSHPLSLSRALLPRPHLFHSSVFVSVSLTCVSVVS